jgi:hypothetical protein
MEKIINKRAYKKDTMFIRFNNFIFRAVSFLVAIPDIFFYILLFVSLIVTEYYNFHLNPDAAKQFDMLKNLVNGHGITVTSLGENNQVIYLPDSQWPAGLVIFLVPIYLLTKSAVASALILKQTSNLFFLLFLAKYFDYLKLKSYQRKFIILFFTISVAPFIEFNASDLIATVMCLWGFYFFIKYLEGEKNKELYISLLLLGVCYFVKYSFLPFLFFPATAFLLKERVAVFKKLKQYGLIILITIISMSLFYFLNRLLVGQMQMQSSLDAFNGHPHWSQLKHFDGFLFTFGIYEWVFQNSINYHFGIKMQFNWISIFVTVYLYILLIIVFFRKKQKELTTSLQNSLNTSLSAGALITLFLAFLTLNNPYQTWSESYWTFVQETRYYGPVILIGLINILILFLTERKGSFIHFVIPLMIVLNLFAYRTVIQSGFWGNNYKDYVTMKNQVDEELNNKNKGHLPIVYFEKNTKNTNPYCYLQSKGVILLGKSKNSITLGQGNFAYYELKKDSTERTPRLVRIQN